MELHIVFVVVLLASLYIKIGKLCHCYPKSVFLGTFQGRMHRF